MARDPGSKCAQSTSLPPGVSGQMSPAKTDPQRVPFGREFGWQREDRVNVFGRERVQTAESFLKQRDLTNLTRGAETMTNRTMSGLLLILMLFTFSVCVVIESIFQAGMLVVFVIVLVVVYAVYVYISAIWRTLHG